MYHWTYDSNKEMGYVGLNIQGTTFNDSKVNLIAEEQSERQSENNCLHEWNEKAESLMLPQAKVMFPNKNQSCCFCKGNGHLAVDCPFNDKESDIICLKCGETGHEMISCNNDYPPDDLTKIHCYACNESSHIFCGSFVDINPQVVSCFNCGKTGHNGSLHVTAEEHSEDTCQHHELKEKVETVLMAPAEDLSPIKIDAEREEFFEEASISLLQQQQQQSAYQDHSESKLKSKSVLSRRRYFDFGTFSSEDPVSNLLAHVPCKPCYFCGQFHDAKRCPKARACYFCKEKGHFAVHCPKNVKESDRFCLKCGEKGHEMTSCNIDYCHDDLTKICCYACDKLGHLFCGSITDTNPQALSCFNCGDTIHNGLQCPKPHLKCGSRPPPLCYKCGEAGHAARNCQNDSRPCGDIQGSALHLVATGDDSDVQQSRKRARRNKAYKHGRLKTHKLRHDSVVKSNPA